MTLALARHAEGGRRPGRLPLRSVSAPGVGAAALTGAATGPAVADLGSCVLVSLAGGWARAGMTEEGVVIEVVRAGRGARSADVLYPRTTGSSRSSVDRYVVQCRNCWVLRRAAEMIVVCL